MWGVLQRNIGKVLRCAISPELVTYGFVKLLAKLDVGLVGQLRICQSTISRPVQNLSILLQNLGSHSRTNINRYPQKTSQHWILVWELHRLITKHYPLIETELAKLTDVSSLTR